MQLHRTHLVSQPVGKLVLISVSELAKPEGVPDLGAVHLDLLSHVCHRSSRKFRYIARETSFDLKELQDQT